MIRKQSGKPLKNTSKFQKEVEYKETGHMLQNISPACHSEVAFIL